MYSVTEEEQKSLIIGAYNYAGWWMIFMQG